MLEPQLVTKILYEMKRKVCHTEISVKCRVGVTGRESYEELVEFLRGVEVSCCC
jgi:tRNA-dihydrouridine synthase